MILKITETEFQQTIIDAAHLFGWQVAHFRPARVLVNGKETYRTAVSADGVGFPDLILIKPPRLLVVEVKSDKGRLSFKQEEWIVDFMQCGIECHLWKPCDDWQEIVDCLKKEVINGCPGF